MENYEIYQEFFGAKVNMASEVIFKLKISFLLIIF
jgi:hypothetical protein